MSDQRERRLVAVVPYALLAILVVVTAAVRRGEARIIDLALCALAAAWMLGGYTLRPAARERPRAMALFVAGLIAIMAVLVVRDPWFGLFTPAAYLYAFRVLRWPSRLAGVAAVAVVAGTAQASGVSLATPAGMGVYAAVLAVNVLPMCFLAWLDWTGDERSDRRDRMLDQVRKANRRLEESLAENATLQERLVAQARTAGVLDERARMAREIHDTLAQGLTGIVTQLQAAEQAADEPDVWQRHVGAATRLARESLSEARRSVGALRPEPLESTRLDDALAAVAERWSALHEVPIRVTTTGTPRPLAPEIEVTLLRTAQEALANIARHAAAGRVGLTLSYRADEVALDVRDDGRGFVAGSSADRGSSGGFGLVAMRQRVEERSGILRVESEPGAGTAVSAVIPTGAVDHHPPTADVEALDERRRVDAPAAADVSSRTGSTPPATDERPHPDAPPAADERPHPDAPPAVDDRPPQRTDEGPYMGAPQAADDRRSAGGPDAADERPHPVAIDAHDAVAEPDRDPRAGRTDAASIGTHR